MAIEYEIEFAARPDADQVVLELDFPAGVSFHFQPELTLQEIADGAHRPENVIGSYAVFYNRSGRLMDGAGNEIENYETGKLAHIYRPWVEDANGDRRWCEQAVDPVAKTLTITMPASWLDVAVYPVVLGPTFGYTPIGGSTHAIGSAYALAAGPESPATSGDATSVSLYLSAADGSPNYTFGIYDSTPSSLLKDTAGGVVTTGWNQQSLDSSQAVVGSTDYYLGIATDGNSGTFRYDSSGGSELKYKSDTYSAGVLLDPYSQDGTLTDRRYSIYATYTEAGGASPTSHLHGPLVGCVGGAI